MAQLFQTPEKQALEAQKYQDLVSNNESVYGAEEQARRSFSAGVQNSPTLGIIREAGRLFDYERDPTFDPQKQVLEDEQVRKEVGSGLYDPETRESLLGSKSLADYAERKQYALDTQARAKEIAADPVYGIAGSLAVDLPVALLSGTAGLAVGRAATAIGASARLASTASLATDATVSLGETAVTAYALQQGNPNVTAADLGFAIIGVAGSTLHGLRTVSRRGKAFLQSSPEAPTVRTAGDAGDYTNPVAHTAELDVPVTVRPGEKHVTFTEVGAEGDTVKVRIEANAGDARTVVRAAKDGNYYISTGAPVTAKGVVARTAGDLLALVPADAVVQARTLIKALKQPEVFESLRNDVRAVLPTNEAERLAPYFESNQSFLLALQDPVFARQVQSLDVAGKDYLDPVIQYSAKADAKPSFVSDELATLNNDEVVNAGRNALADKKLKQNFVEKLLSAGNGFVSKQLSLHDRIGYAGDKARTLANRLFTNGSASGARIDSASDIKRTFELQYQAQTAAVQDSLEALVRLDGVKATDRFTANSKFSAVLYKHADNVTRFMQTQFQLERRGEPLQAIPSEYAEVIENIQAWSRSRRELLQQSGQEGVENFSDWYVPIKYDFAETQAVLASKGIKSERAIAELMQQALEDAYPTLDAAKVKEIANAFQDRVTGVGLQTKRTLADQLASTGDDLQDAVRELVRPTTPALTQNLRRRTGINTDTKYIVDGQELSFQDLMQKDFVSGMRSYDNALQGKLALREAGLDTEAKLNKAVAEAELEVPVKDRANWKQIIEEGIGSILGNNPPPTPAFVSLIGKFASGTFLRNSGLYQAVDTGFVHMQFGTRAIRKAMQKETQALVEGLKDKATYSQLNTILDGAYITDTKAAYINRKIENTVNLTGADRIIGIGNNVASAAQTLNGMRIVQKGQQGLVGHIMRLQLHNLLTAEGADLAAARKVYTEVGGLTEAELNAIRKTGQDAPLGNALQQRLNNAHSRMLDTVVQQNRVGELPAWAEYTNAGQILVGFGKFALAAFNKVLRRLSQERGVFNGIAAATLYTAPWMIAAQTLIAARDGKLYDKEGNVKWEDIVAKSASTLTVWGPGSALADALFGTGKANFGNPGFDWLAGALEVPSKVAGLDTNAGSAIGKAVPFLGLIPGATALLNEGFSNAAAARDAALEEVTE